MEARVRRYARLAREPLLTSHLRGDPENRFWAKVIDFAFVETIVFCGHFMVSWVSFAFPVFLWPFFERMGRGQSPGKWLLGLQTVEGGRGEKPNVFQCLVRNIPMLLLSASLGLSGLWQWLLFTPAMLLCVLEAYFIFSLRSGIRVGDIFSNTRVFDYKDEHTQFIEQFLKEPDIS